MVYDQLKLQNQLCFRLYTASRLVTQTYFPILENIGITYPQYLVLMVLWEEDGMKVMELAHKLFLDSNTVTPLVQRMDKLGIVKREKGKVDGRETYVHLTEKGKELQEKAKDVPSCMLERILTEAMQMEDIKALSTQLDNLIDNLSEQREQVKQAAKEERKVRR